MKLTPWSRRKFLGVAVALPIGAVIGCGPDGINAPDASSGGPPDGGSPGAADAGYDPGGWDAGGMEDAGMDAGTALDGGLDGGMSEEHVCADSFPRLDLKADFAAAGDGKTNDTAAFRKAAKRLQMAGGGELVIPPGVYVVGRQIAKDDPNADPNQGPWYAHEDIFTVTDLSCLKISGYGAILRVPDGLHYGGYDPQTGMPADWNDNQHPNRAAEVGRIIELVRCDNVLIEGLEIDGNNGKLVIGGQYGNAGIQGAATGLSMNMCQNVTVVDVHTHHHGLDGITVRYTNGPPPKKMPHTFKNVVSEYNGRQALSWIGGWGLYCTDCKFNHTGRTFNQSLGKTFFSLPGAGVDIEPNIGTTQKSIDSVFTRCEFANNFGNGLEAVNGDSTDHLFVDCTFWGTRWQSIYASKPNMTFQNCKIHGTMVRGHSTMRFEGCTFEDKEWTSGKVYRQGALVALTAGFDGMTWLNCTFINHKVPAVITKDATAIEAFRGCTFIHSASNLTNGAAQSRFVGSKLRGCQFKESADVSNGSRSYFIALDTVSVLAPAAGEDPTHVDGPKVKWGSTSGDTGDIAPGSY